MKCLVYGHLTMLRGICVLKSYWNRHWEFWEGSPEK